MGTKGNEGKAMQMGEMATRVFTVLLPPRFQDINFSNP